MARRSKRNSKAWFISDRSGMRFPMNESVVEDNGLLVHKSETDGQWSLLKHPLNNLAKYLKGKMGDPYPVEMARPDRNWVEPQVYQGQVRITGQLANISTYPTIVHRTAASISATGRVVPSGIRNRPGASAIIGAGAVSSAGLKAKLATSAITGTGTLQGAGARRLTAFSSILGTSSVAALGVRAMQGLASLFGTSSVSGTGLRRRVGASSITGTGNLIGSGLHKKTGISAITGMGLMTSVGSSIYRGVSNLVSTSSVSGTGLRRRVGASSITGTGNLIGSGTIPGAVVLLEGFETTPAALNTLYTAGPAWSQIAVFDGSGFSFTPTRTTSHVTQGSFSLRVPGVAGSSPAVAPATNSNISGTLTSSNFISVDIFSQTLNALDIVALVINDGTGNTYQALSTPGQTGAFTLTINTAAITSYTNVSFTVLMCKGGTFGDLTSACDIYIDNLRAT